MDYKPKIIEPDKHKLAPDTQPAPVSTITSEQPPQSATKKRSTSLMNMFVITIAICSIVVCALFVVPWFGFFNKCSTAAKQAQTSADNAAKQLNTMTFLNGKTTQATPQISGDCIDTRTHDGEARARFDVNDTLANLDNQVSSNLTSLGYRQEQDFRYGGGTININDAYVNYRKDDDVISVAYSLTKYYECPQSGEHIRECDKSDQAALMQQKIRKVEVTLYPAGGSHPNQ